MSTFLVWAFILLPVALGFAVRRSLNSTFARYRQVPSRAGANGATVARALLDAHGLQRVRVEVTPGTLSDHYDPQAGALRLSGDIARGSSVAALGITAHEVSHAYQDAEGSRAYRARKAVGEPLMRLAPFSGFFLIGGFWLDSPLLVALSLVYVAGLVLFALATLPVEYGASRRALRLLRETRLAADDELREIRSVLRAAASTYVVGLLYQLGFLGTLLIFAIAMERAME